MNQLQQAIKAYKRTYPRRKTLPRPPVPLFPKGIERTYARELLKFVADMQAQFRRIFRDQPAPRLDSTEFRQDNDEIFRRIQEFELSIERELSESKARQMLEAKSRDISGHNWGQVSKQTMAVVGISIPSYEPKVHEMMKLWVEENVGLIDSIKAETRNKLKTRILEGVQAGQRWETLVAGIERDLGGQKGVFKSVRNRARLIARDQVASLNGNLARQRMTSVGGTKYKWLATMDQRTRDSHRQRNAKIYTWKNPKHGGGHPGNEINCRCVAQMVFEEDEE